MGGHNMGDCYSPDAKPGKQVALRDLRFGLLGGGCRRGSYWSRMVYAGGYLGGWFAVGLTPGGASPAPTDLGGLLRFAESFSQDWDSLSRRR